MPVGGVQQPAKAEMPISFRSGLAQVVVAVVAIPTMLAGLAVAYGFDTDMSFAEVVKASGAVVLIAATVLLVARACRRSGWPTPSEGLEIYGLLVVAAGTSFSLAPDLFTGPATSDWYFGAWSVVLTLAALFSPIAIPAESGG
jgi:hypothetical protein